MTVNLTLPDARGGRLIGARVKVEADMSHPGMSPVFADANELSPGNYQAQLLLGMAGDWVIILHVTLPRGQQFERQIDLKGVRTN